MRNTSPITHPAGNPEPQSPVRLAAFAKFFKAYMGTASVVTAALPIPVATLHLIPTFAAQEKFLSVYTSLFCFLMLAYLFYIRHGLGRLMFSTRPDGHVVLRSFLAFVPLLLILSSLGLVALYHYYLTRSLQVFTQQGVMNRTNEILGKADYREIPYSLQLTACYLGMFLTAESAFILMALREYLQDVLHIGDASLLRIHPPRSRKKDEVVLTTVPEAEKVRHAGSSSAS